jgi:hypothetical protein
VSFEKWFILTELYFSSRSSFRRGRDEDGVTPLGYYPASSPEEAIRKAKKDWAKSYREIGWLVDEFKIERFIPVDRIPSKPWAL